MLTEGGPEPFMGEQTLARYLACAWIAYQQGVSIATVARRKYLNETPIGAYWILTARVMFANPPRLDIGGTPETKLTTH